MAKTPAELLAERAKRIKDAYELRVPDRVPIRLNFGYMLARLGGITNQELEHNPDKAQALLEKYALYFGRPNGLATAWTPTGRSSSSKGST
jgi:hypothetical protein